MRARPRGARIRACLLPPALFAALLVSGCASTAAAQEAVSRPVGAGAPKVAFDAVSATGLAAFGATVAPGQRQIVARRVTSDGQPLEPLFELSRAPAGAEISRPDIAFNASTREYLVVWAVSQPARGRGALRARRVSVDGAPIGPTDFAVGRGTLSDAAQPVVASGSGRGFLVAFETSGATIRARLLSKLGRLVRETHRLSGSSACGDPQAAYRSRAREYLVEWSCDARQGSSVAHHARRVRTSGATAGGDLVVMAGGRVRAGSGESALAYNPLHDEFLLVTQGFATIHTQRLRGRGAPVGPVRSLPGRSFNVEARFPTVAFSPPMGRYLVGWIGFRRGPASDPVQALHLVRIDASGKARGPVSVSNERADFPSIASKAPREGFLVGFATEPQPGVQEGLVEPAS